MSKKSAKIAALIENCRGEDLNAHFLGYFKCFNQELFYEAHEVLEELWLADRQGPNGDFFKGLIQFAGAFALLQKDRLPPAARLFKLAQVNLEKFPSTHLDLDIAQVVALIEEWVKRIEKSDSAGNPLKTTQTPKLSLQTSKRLP
jgi:predicted metal-dependent hydrolase